LLKVLSTRPYVGFASTLAGLGSISLRSGFSIVVFKEYLPTKREAQSKSQPYDLSTQRNNSRYVVDGIFGIQWMRVPGPMKLLATILPRNPSVSTNQEGHEPVLMPAL